MSSWSSNCCGAPVYDPWNTGEGRCCECHEMCFDEEGTQNIDEREEEHNVVNLCKDAERKIDVVVKEFKVL